MSTMLVPSPGADLMSIPYGSAIQQMNAAFDVAQRHMRVAAVVGLGRGQCGRVKAHAVVADADVDRVLFLPDADAHPAALPLWFQPVHNAVFHERLDGQLGQRVIQDFRILEVDGVLQLFLEPLFLQRQIIFHIFQLFAEGNGLLAVMDDVCAQQLRQVLHGRADGGLAGRHAAHVDQLQNVENKVRLDLGFQLADFRIAQEKALLVDLIKQGVQPVGHIVEGMGEGFGFAVRCFVHADGQVAGGQTADAVQHLPQRMQEQHDKRGRNEQREQQDDRRDQDINLCALPDAGQNFTARDIKVNAFAVLGQLPRGMVPGRPVQRNLARRVQPGKGGQRVRAIGTDFAAVCAAEQHGRGWVQRLQGGNVEQAPHIQFHDNLAKRRDAVQVDEVEDHVSVAFVARVGVQGARRVAVLIALIHGQDAPGGVPVIVSPVDRKILLRAFQQIDGADHVRVQRIAKRKGAAELLLELQNLDLGHPGLLLHHAARGGVRGQVVDAVPQRAEHAVGLFGKLVEIDGHRLAGVVLELPGYGAGKVDARADHRQEHQQANQKNRQRGE